MFLTPEQLRDVMAIVDRHHNAFIANFVSPSALPPETLAKLEAAGIVKPQVQGIRDAYMFGVLAANLPSGGGPTVSYAQLADRLARNPFPLSAVEKQAVSVAQMSAGQYISGLGAKVQTQVGQAIMQADKAAQRRRTQADRGRADANGVMMVTDPATAAADSAAYKQVIAEGIQQRKQLGSIVSDLGHATGEWARDLERVAVTETQNAMQQGTANVIAAQHGEDARVAKLAANNCCDQCRRLYVDSTTGKPVIFALKDLQANGDNYGRKARDWRPVVGSTHPNCQCYLVTLPAGMTFDDKGMMVAESTLNRPKSPKT